MNGAQPTVTFLAVFGLLLISQHPCSPSHRPNVDCQGESTSVYVSRDSGKDCSDVRESLSNRTCSDLQDVLLSIATNRTRAPGCIEVHVFGGAYLLNSSISIVNQSLIIQGHENTSVTFEDPETCLAEAYYVVLLAKTEYAAFSGIHFHDSPGILGFEEVSNVTITNSTFRHFCQGAVDVYFSSTVYVENCTFENNGPVSLLKTDKFRGQAGGLSIGTNTNKSDTLPLQYVVKDCVFRNNTSTPVTSFTFSTSQIFQQFLFPARGGGCTIIMNTSLPVNVTIENCKFENNAATSFGGGLYLGLTGYGDRIIHVIRTKFERNRSGSAGGLQYGFLDGIAEGVDIRLIVQHSEFIENSAVYGGGTFVYAAGPTTRDGRLDNFAHFNNCTFRGNFASEAGAAIDAINPVFFSSTGGITPLNIIDCQFIGNQGGSGGTLSSAYFPLDFKGHTNFSENIGHSLVLVGALVELHGAMYFYDNGSPILDSAALYLTSVAQIQLFRGAELYFINNQGLAGAALEVLTQHIPDLYTSLSFNQLCSFLSENGTQDPESWDVTMEFSDNYAIYASSVFTDNIALCSWTRGSINLEKAFNWSFVSYMNNTNTLHGSDMNNPKYYIQTSPVAINVTKELFKLYPGEEIIIPIIAVDELGKETGAIVRVTDEDLDLVFSPSVGGVFNNSITTTLHSVSWAKAERYSERHRIKVETIITESFQAEFYVEVTGCPAGYALAEIGDDPNYATCNCDLNKQEVMDCQGRTILLATYGLGVLLVFNVTCHVLAEENLWGSTGLDGTLHTHYCPPYYCECRVIANQTFCDFVFSSENPDDQCHCDRRGVLCGQCVDGKGVSALLNYCVKCSNAYIVLIFALVVADVLVLICLFALKTPLPSWLYPFIFYLQVFPYLTMYFPKTFEKIQPFLYYVSSGLSLYFIYDFCIYENMSPLFSYFLRFTPLLISAVVGAVFVCLRYRKKTFREPWHGPWWVILLQFTHVVHTSMSILNCPSLDGQHYWFIDGTVTCFDREHITLGLLAIAALIFCTSLIISTLLYSYKALNRPFWIRSVVIPLRDEVGRNCKIWPVMELGRRLVIVLLVLVFPGNDYPVIFLLMVWITIYGYLQPFQRLLSNLLEIVLSIATLIMLLLRNTQTLFDSLQLIQSDSYNNSNQCENRIEGITDMAALLGVTYYLPLASFLIAVSIWAAAFIRQCVKLRWKKSNEDDDSVPDQYLSWNRASATYTTVTLQHAISESGDMHLPPTAESGDTTGSNDMLLRPAKDTLPLASPKTEDILPQIPTVS